MDDIENIYKDVLIATLQVRIAGLEAALKSAHTDPEFMVLTRRGIEHRWHERTVDVDTVIFFDMDNIHAHNEHHGYADTDARIRLVMSHINHIWLFRWFSGDEFGLLCAAADAPGFAHRVQRLLEAEGMTATFGIAPIISNDLKASVIEAASMVQAAKSRGMRNTINQESHNLKLLDVTDRLISRS